VSDPRARLTSALRPVVEAIGADLEDLSVTPAGRRRVVRVVVDRDGGISLDGVADVSRVLSEALDALDAREPELLAGAYVLEVSSPGVDRPLTAARHWRRNVRRLVTATLRDGGSVTGRVLRVEGEQAVALDVDGHERLLPLADVVKGVVQVEFARPGSDGADETDDVDDEADDLAAEADELHATELLAAADDPEHDHDDHDEEAP
jgi:ribosome maturation factor RimP